MNSARLIYSCLVFRKFYSNTLNFNTINELRENTDVTIECDSSSSYYIRYITIHL